MRFGLHRHLVVYEVIVALIIIVSQPSFGGGVWWFQAALAIIDIDKNRLT